MERYRLASTIIAKTTAYISDHTAAAIKKVRNSSLGVRERFLPEWYLRKGTINAPEEKLEAASDSCELWSKWCAWLVVVSIVAEFVIAALEPAYILFLKLSAAADAGVAFGIVGEVLLGMRNNRIQTELRKRSNDRLAQVEFDNGYLIESAAKANARAEEAILALARFRAPRRLSDEQGTRLVNKMWRFKGTKFVSGVSSHDEEVVGLASAIVFCLLAAGWIGQDWPWPGETTQLPVFPSAKAGLGAIISEVCVSTPMDDESSHEAASALAESLGAESITVLTPTASGSLICVLVGPKR
jgi:hypothetical protein